MKVKVKREERRVKLNGVLGDKEDGRRDLNPPLVAFRTGNMI